MRVSDEVLKCVGFVSKGENILDYRGTAFIVSVPHDESSGCLHLVTAKHVALAIPSGEACISDRSKEPNRRRQSQQMARECQTT